MGHSLGGLYPYKTRGQGSIWDCKKDGMCKYAPLKTCYPVMLMEMECSLLPNNEEENDLMVSNDKVQRIGVGVLQ